MGWLKTMKVINYLALLAVLINCSRLTLARPDGATATTPASTTIANNGGGGSSSAAATTARERSTKVSSERTKGKFFTSIYIMQEMRCWMRCRKLFVSDTSAVGNYWSFSWSSNPVRWWKPFTKNRFNVIWWLSTGRNGKKRRSMKNCFMRCGSRQCAFVWQGRMDGGFAFTVCLRKLVACFAVNKLSECRYVVACTKLKNAANWGVWMKVGKREQGGN